jgi:hypothetical protein
VVVDGGEDGGESRVELFNGLFVRLRLEGALKSVDDMGEAATKGGTGDANESGESTGVEGGDGLGDETGNKDGEDLLGANLHDLAKGFEGGVGGVSRRLEGVQERRDGLVDRAGTDDLLSNVERLSGGGTNSRVRVDKGGADGGDDGVLVSLERRLGGVGHELGESKADTLALATVGGTHRLLKDRDDLAENRLSETTASVGQAAGGGLRGRKESVREVGRRPEEKRTSRWSIPGLARMRTTICTVRG